MTIEFATQHWAALFAALLGLGILLFVLYRVSVDSARGQLRGKVRTLKSRHRDLRRAEKTVSKAAAALKNLQAKSARVKPRHVQEASEALDDARSLMKIASDRVLIAENHVRKVIVEEFPPKRQDALRNQYLHRPEGDDRRPFSF